MWTSAELKERAKIALSGTYWKAFAVALVVGLLSGGGSGGASSSYTNSSNGGYSNIEPEMIGIIVVVALIVLVFALAFGFFVSGPISVGGMKYFITASEVVGTEETAEFGLIGFGFKGKHYLNVAKTMFLKDLYIMLWSLLLIIPGIVKGYAYAMVPYLLADNPNMSTKRAIQLSNQMTMGEKMDMFILDLSFIGWALLAMIPCCLGFLFLNPYYMSTHAELYRVLRDKALEEGMTTYEELGFAAPKSGDDSVEFASDLDDRNEF